MSLSQVEDFKSRAPRGGMFWFCEALKAREIMKGFLHSTWAVVEEFSIQQVFECTSAFMEQSLG